MELQTAGDGATSTVPTATVSRRKSAPAPAPKPDTAAVAWIKANRDDLNFTEAYRDIGVASYAANTEALERVVAAGPPSICTTPFSAEDMPGILSESIDIDRFRFSEDEWGRLLPGVLDLMQSRGFARAVHTVGDISPTDRHSAPRLGMVAHEVVLGSITYTEGKGCYLLKCELTGEPFSSQAGAAVPCLIFDEAPANGSVWPTGCVDPQDGPQRHLVIHPALMIAGREWVLRAYWHHLESKISDALSTLGLSIQRMTLLLGTEPEDIGFASPALALYSWDVFSRSTRPDPDAPLSDKELDDLMAPSGWKNVD